MSWFSKKNAPLIAAISIPFLMIILIAAFIYIPSVGKFPTHDFVYISGYNQYYGNSREYVVKDGHIIHNPMPDYEYAPGDSAYTYREPEPTFYYYNIHQGAATEITFEEAQKYTLDSSNISEDGYTIERGNYGGDLFFGGSGDYNKWYIKGHNRSVKLNIKTVTPDYYNFELMGWIK